MDELRTEVSAGLRWILFLLVSAPALSIFVLVLSGAPPWLLLGALVATSLLVTLAILRLVHRRIHRPLVEALGHETGQLDASRAETATLREAWTLHESRLTAEEERRLETHRELVANISHELKTPLTSIRGYAETLADGALEDPETARRFTHRILDQCERLEALLRDLLTLSRLEARSQERDPQPLDTIPIAHHALETLAPLAQRREVVLDLRVDDPPPRPVDAEAEDVERLLLNLVENAIKYNRPGGSVTLVLGGTVEGVRIEVHDTGIGIPRHDLERIFERFYRVDKGRTRSQGGTGLGLSIVSRLIEGQGGKIEVESRLGHGSTFRIALPAAPPSGSSGATHEGGDSPRSEIVISSTDDEG